MSNHHYVNVRISGTNAAVAANAVKEYFADGGKPDGWNVGSMVKDEVMLLAEHDAARYFGGKPDIVLVGAYSGRKPITLIAELSKHFPTEQYDLSVSGDYGGGTFQGTMTIQNEEFFDVLDYEDPNKVEWSDLFIKKRDTPCEHLITTFTKTAEGEEKERCACGMVAIEQEDKTWKEVC
jgi:hypothetical protein